MPIKFNSNKLKEIYIKYFILMLLCVFLVSFINNFILPITNENLEPLSLPSQNGRVAVTFPSKQFVENTEKSGPKIIGLGQHETFKDNIEVQLLEPTPMALAKDTPDLHEYVADNAGHSFSFESDGFEVTRFDKRLLNRIEPIFDKELSDPNIDNVEMLRHRLRNYLPCMEAFVSRYYSRKFNIPESELLVIASKNPLPRIAGLSQENSKGIIQANPLMHIDYFSDYRGYKIQTDKDVKWHEDNNISISEEETFFPSQEHLYDMVNIWVPLNNVENYDLGFVPNSDFDQKSIIEVELFNGAKAATVEYKESMNRILYRPKMKPGEIYIFRSTTMSKYPDTKQGILHGSFLSNSQQNVHRRSAEYRFMIFHKESEGLNIYSKLLKDDNKTLKDIISHGFHDLSNVKRNFINFINSKDGHKKSIRRKAYALDSLNNSWIREWQQSLPGTLNGNLVQGVREVNSPGHKKSLSSLENKPLHSVSFQSNFLKEILTKDSKTANLRIDDLGCITNKFGVIEVFNGFANDLNDFENSYASSDLATIREEPVTKKDLTENSTLEMFPTTLGILRSTLKPDIKKMFQQLNLPVNENKKYYFTAELFGGGTPPNFHFWHQDRSIIISRNKSFESKDRERVPFAYQGFLYYTGLPSWFMLEGEVKNAIEYFKESHDNISYKNNDSLFMWFKETPFHAVPTKEEITKACPDCHRRFFLRIRVFQVDKDFFIPTKEEAKDMNSRFDAWQKGNKVSGSLVRK
ncbi:MAG: hypothetical protein HOI53_05260 [Francisellaceae bacterium]|jgi:hypothetical protein|nr:hypothetical protein [Francisellaceae bacterium]MBT6207414.1 hypothetical protein [Francisellaceae bacterium]MBT6537851.1 hypothetical protein [Francisellaceae bacterium]